MDPDVDVGLEQERRRLLSLGYRMTGTLADAEDVVQETYLRWYRLTDDERAAIANPAGWLTRVASRVALDVATSARARRERAAGQWLPEPVPAHLFAGTAHGSPEDPADRVTLDDAVNGALLLVLEAMTPAERVAFVLHDVFGVPFPEIAEVVGRSPAATRQLASSARRHVREHRATVVSREEHARAVHAFVAAAASGDLDQLTAALAPGVTLRSDGGGVVNVAQRVVHGPDRVARFLLGLLAKRPGLGLHEEQTADGLGYRLTAEGRTYGMATFAVQDGRVSDVRFALDPAKLTSWSSDER